MYNVFSLHFMDECELPIHEHFLLHFMDGWIKLPINQHFLLHFMDGWISNQHTSWTQEMEEKAKKMIKSIM